MTTEKPAWTIRTGKYGERDEWALNGGLVGGGWNEIPDLSGISSKQEMESLVTEVYGNDKPGQVRTNTGQLWSLRSRIEVGDLMILPLKTKRSQIAFGVVTRPYEYLVKEQDPSRKHVVGVDWRRVDAPRTAIKGDLLNSLGSALTIFQSRRNDAQWRLLQVMENGSDPGARGEILALPGDGEDDVNSDLATPDLEEYGLNRIQTLIQENFANHDLARLVEALLSCEGFVCERKLPGPDGGVDILAGQGPLGLSPTRLVVQVKSEAGPVGDPVVQALQGALNRFSADEALLVAWGGVSKQAERYLETMKFSVRVWDSGDLIRSVLKNYSKLPEDIRSELPLKQIWVPLELGTN